VIEARSVGRQQSGRGYQVSGIVVQRIPQSHFDLEEIVYFVNQLLQEEGCCLSLLEVSKGISCLLRVESI
jgi:hypothetical protein